MKKFSRKLVLLLSLVAVLAIAVGSTLAYLQVTTGLLKNAFSMADVHTGIEEKFEGRKQITITNTGKSDAYVRVRLSFSGLTKVQMDKVVVNHSSGYDDVKDADHVTILTNGKWAQTDEESTYFNQDEFFYYEEVVKAGQSTTIPLEVVVGSDAGIDKNQNFEVIVYHESVLARDTDLTKPSQIEKQFQ